MRFLPLFLLLLVTPLLSQTKGDTLRAKTAFLENRVANFRAGNFINADDTLFLDAAGMYQVTVLNFHVYYSPDSMLEIMKATFRDTGTLNEISNDFLFYKGTRTYIHYDPNEGYFDFGNLEPIRQLPDSSYLLQWESFDDMAHIDGFCQLRPSDTLLEPVPVRIQKRYEQGFYNTSAYYSLSNMYCSSFDHHDTSFYWMKYNPESLTIYYRYTGEIDYNEGCNTWDGEFRFENGSFIQQEEHLAVPQPVKK